MSERTMDESTGEPVSGAVVNGEQNVGKRTVLAARRVGRMRFLRIKFTGECI